MSPASEQDLIRERLRSVVILRSELGEGTGFYVTSTGLLVTNKHVVGPLLEVGLQRFDQSEARVRVVRVSPTCDLAVLWDSTAAALPPPLPIADASEVTSGQTVFAIGHPSGLEFTLTRGIISSTDRIFRGVSYVQTDATAHPGSSGGPLLNLKGEVVGVSTFGALQAGLNFALSARYVPELVGEISVRTGRREVRKCPSCGASNLPVRRACRRCGVGLEDVPVVEEAGSVEVRRAASGPATSRTDPVGGDELGAQSKFGGTPGMPHAPALKPGSDPALVQVVRALSLIEPRPESVDVHGSVVEVQWSDCCVTVTVFASAPEPHLTALAFVSDVSAADESTYFRAALERNLSGTIEAKLGLRGSQLYVSAERALEGLDDPEVRTVVKRVADVRRRFLSEFVRRSS